MPINLIPTPKRWRQENLKFKIIFSYTESISKFTGEKQKFKAILSVRPV